MHQLASPNRPRIFPSKATMAPRHQPINPLNVKVVHKVPYYGNRLSPVREVLPQLPCLSVAGPLGQKGASHNFMQGESRPNRATAIPTKESKSFRSISSAITRQIRGGPLTDNKTRNSVDTETDHKSESEQSEYAKSASPVQAKYKKRTNQTANSKARYEADYANSPQASVTPLITSFKTPSGKFLQRKIMPKVPSSTPYESRKKSKLVPTIDSTPKKGKPKEELLFDEEGYYSSNAVTTAEDIGARPMHCAAIKNKSIEPEAKNPRHQINLLKSVFADRTPTVFFPYPKCCQLTRKNDRTIPMVDKFKLKYKITDSVCTYNCVIGALKAAGFTQTEGPNWNVLWSAPLQPETLKNFSKYQRCNHFPGTWQLGRKDNLWKNISRMRRKFGDDYDICPPTFILPEDYARLSVEKEADAKSFWIMKPVASSCGKGIKLIPRGGKVPKKPGFLVSKYISNPHLINKYKYDLRIYVLITSFDPLRIYMYKNGLVRFATEKYTTSNKSCKKRFVHLTNYAVNKNAPKFKANIDPKSDGLGSKWSLLAYKEKLGEMGVDVEGLFSRIKDVIIKACISSETHIYNSMTRGTKHKNLCFELYGFDILVDDNLRPWLLEVNVQPSLSSSSPLDKQIKTSMLSDTFNIVGIVPYDRKKYIKEEETKKVKYFLGLESKKLASLHKAKNINELKSADTFEDLSEEDLELLLYAEEENYRRGQFEKIFPLSVNIDKYSPYFEAMRYSNLLLWRWLKSSSDYLKVAYNQISTVPV